MHFSSYTIIASALLLSSAFAGSLSKDLVPPSCSSICQPILDISTACTSGSSTKANIAARQDYLSPDVIIPDEYPDDDISLNTSKQPAKQVANSPYCICSSDSVKAAGTAALCMNCIQEFGDSSKISADQMVNPCSAPATDATDDDGTYMDSNGVMLNKQSEKAQMMSGSRMTARLELPAALVGLLTVSWFALW